MLVGNMNVGKSTIFSRICGSKASSVNIPGNTVTIKKGKIKGLNGAVFDTPGIHSIFAVDEDDRGK